jgi:hypothetical protein
LLRGKGLGQAGQLAAFFGRSVLRGNRLRHEVQQDLALRQRQGGGVGHRVGGAGQQVADGHRGLQCFGQQANGQVERARHMAQQLALGSTEAQTRWG